MKPSMQKLTVLAATTAMAFGATGVAQAKHGADDAAGHRRHVHHRHHHHHSTAHKHKARGVDDAGGQKRNGADDAAGHH